MLIVVVTLQNSNVVSYNLITNSGLQLGDSVELTRLILKPWFDIFPQS